MIAKKFESETAAVCAHADAGCSTDCAAGAQRIETKARELYDAIDGTCCGSREKSLTMTKLEECVMWANAAISRCGVVDE